MKYLTLILLLVGCCKTDIPPGFKLVPDVPPPQPQVEKPDVRKDFVAPRIISTDPKSYPTLHNPRDVGPE